MHFGVFLSFWDPLGAPAANTLLPQRVTPEVSGVRWQRRSLACNEFSNRGRAQTSRFSPTAMRCFLAMTLCLVNGVENHMIHTPWEADYEVSDTLSYSALDAISYTSMIGKSYDGLMPLTFHRSINHGVRNLTNGSYNMQRGGPKSLPSTAAFSTTVAKRGIQNNPRGVDWNLATPYDNDTRLYGGQTIFGSPQESGPIRSECKYSTWMGRDIMSDVVKAQKSNAFHDQVMGCVPSGEHRRGDTALSLCTPWRHGKNMLKVP